MDSPKDDFFGDTYKLLQTYINDRILLLKVETAEKSGNFASSIVKALVVAVLVIMIFLFLSALGAIYFSELFNSYFYGFATMTGIYILALIKFLILHKYYISKKIKNAVIQGIFEPSKVEQDLDIEDYD